MDLLGPIVDTLRLDLLGELVLAVLIGGLIGLEREASGKPAGLRTNILICLGATLITDISLGMGAELPDGGRADGARLAAQVVSGIGFLGAGTIMQARGTVTGLTSAATLWVVAAIGIAIGSRHTVEAVGTAVLVLLILIPLGHFERRISSLRRVRRFTLEVARTPAIAASLVEALTACGLAVRSEHAQIDGERLILRLDLDGDPKAWRAAQDALVVLPEVLAMRVQ